MEIRTKNKIEDRSKWLDINLKVPKTHTRFLLQFLVVSTRNFCAGTTGINVDNKSRRNNQLVRGIVGETIALCLLAWVLTFQVRFFFLSFPFDSVVACAWLDVDIRKKISQIISSVMTKIFTINFIRMSNTCVCVWRQLYDYHSGFSKGKEISDRTYFCKKYKLESNAYLIYSTFCNTVRFSFYFVHYTSPDVRDIVRGCTLWCRVQVLA